MKAFDEFKDKDQSFWAFIKFISEKLGYSKKQEIRTYSYQEIVNLCNSYSLRINPTLINDASEYIEKRASTLTTEVANHLMDAKKAEQTFQQYYQLYENDNLTCQLPLNKQKGEMKQIAYFTAIINIITEETIKSITGQSGLGFVDDPRSLTYFIDKNNNLTGASSRRFDGAYPNLLNPKIIWEIKEYYYNTSFGSRVADGVYETQLDGYEFQELYTRTGYKPYHVLFVDSYNTWWNLGKSYLCRLIDAINSGIVDEVIFGDEVLTRWPEILQELVP